MSIWEKDSDKPNRLTQKNIELAEKTFGVTLPKSYLKVLKEQNGGYLKTDAVHVDFVNDDGEGFILFDSLYGIEPDEGILATEYLKEEWGITKDNIILIAGDGHSFTALDYEMNLASPEVIHIDTERDDVHKICDDFDSLMDLMFTLEDDDDEEHDEIHIPTHEEIRAWASSTNIDEVASGVYTWIQDFSMVKEDHLFYKAFVKVFDEGTEHQKITVVNAMRMEIENDTITSQTLIDLCLTLLRKETDLDFKIYKEMIEENLADKK
ncbi:SMI1/KNR4 family protein [Listeria booriae]|uniref:SMI1/KNR4 family protein n=2 Tax=Listeria booriae TaxID=1552123 RepID=A0A7X1D5S7_9LIST|nr:SMI1/KNR4 family protein [Listeria booriae]MBC2167046.1 SMI1/KNR4 family protein [Listeria booriae]